MPDDPGRPLSDGRLNLGQQKKRAKELMRAVRAGAPEALARLRRHHPRGERLDIAEVRLADAQAAIAREAGFASWARLKAHTDRLVRARTDMDRREAAPDTAGTLHVRCGSDLKVGLERAGFVGGFLEFSDPYCQGPVLDLPEAALIELRAGFVAEAYRILPDVVLSRLQREYAAWADLSAWEEVVLWFEHDSYDQLILARLLATLPEHVRSSLVCVDHTPGVARFLGLGQLAPEVLRLFYEGRVAVGPGHRRLGREVWGALTDPSPILLHRISTTATPAAPPMPGALGRHLRELPSTANGLALTEQLALDLLPGHGALTGKALFQRLTREREPLPFLGDSMFWAVLRRLAAGGRPLVDAGPPGHHEASWAERTLRLTADGEAVQAGRADWLALGAPQRWVGGIEIDPSGACWRWDEAASRPVLTPPAEGSR